MRPIDFSLYAPQKTFLVQGQHADMVSLQESYQQALKEDDNKKHGAKHIHTDVVDRDVPDTALFFSAPRFTKDHASQIATFINEGSGGNRILYVFFTLFSPDAAQVILKPLEEPDLTTTIVLMTPYPYAVPQTIRSRVMLMASTAVSTDNEMAVGRPLWTKATLQSYVQELCAGDSEEDAATKRARAIALLDELETEVTHNKATLGADVKGVSKKNANATMLYQAKKMLIVANMPTKFVLEYVVSAFDF